MCEIGGKGYTHRDVIRDVGPTFVLIGECVDVLVGGERGDCVVGTGACRRQGYSWR